MFAQKHVNTNYISNNFYALLAVAEVIYPKSGLDDLRAKSSGVCGGRRDRSWRDRIGIARCTVLGAIAGAAAYGAVQGFGT